MSSDDDAYMVDGVLRISIPGDVYKKIVASKNWNDLEHAFSEIFHLSNVVNGNGKPLSGYSMLKDRYDLYTVYRALLQMFLKSRNRLNLLWAKDGVDSASKYNNKAVHAIMDSMFKNASLGEFAKLFMEIAKKQGGTQKDITTATYDNFFNDLVPLSDQCEKLLPGDAPHQMRKDSRFSPGPFNTNLPWDASVNAEVSKPLYEIPLESNQTTRNPTEWMQHLMKLYKKSVAPLASVSPSLSSSPPRSPSVSSVASSSSSASAAPSLGRRALAAVGRGLLSGASTASALFASSDKLNKPRNRSELSQGLKELFSEYDQLRSPVSPATMDKDIDRESIAKIVLNGVSTFLPRVIQGDTNEFVDYRRRLWILMVGAIRWKREGKLNFPTNTTVGSTEDNNLLTEIEEASREWINSRVLMDKIQREEEKKETDLLAPFKKRIDDLTDELRDANKRLADTNREISRLQSNSSATSNQVSDLTNKLQTANTEIIRLQNEITQLKKAASIVSAVVSSSSPPPASVATDPREASIRSVLDSINTDVKAKTNAIIQLALFSSNGSGLTENEKDNNLKIVTSMILTISQFTEAQFQAATKQLRQPSLTLSPLPSSSSSSSSTNPPSLSVRMFQLYAMTL